VSIKIRFIIAKPGADFKGFFEIFPNEKQARAIASPAKSVSQVWI
jgi:hypothetical protein